MGLWMSYLGFIVKLLSIRACVLGIVSAFRGQDRRRDFGANDLGSVWGVSAVGLMILCANTD